MPVLKTRGRIFFGLCMLVVCFKKTLDVAVAGSLHVRGCDGVRTLAGNLTKQNSYEFSGLCCMAISSLLFYL
jgi:hypothetical protein